MKDSSEIIESLNSQIPSGGCYLTVKRDREDSFEIKLDEFRRVVHFVESKDNGQTWSVDESLVASENSTQTHYRICSLLNLDSYEIGKGKAEISCGKSKILLELN